MAKKSLSNCRFSLCYKAKRTVGFSPMAYNGLQPYAGCFSQLALRVLLVVWFFKVFER